jgi:hypothetical protein
MKLYAWIAGAWTAVLWFFTFGVARLLFAEFPRERAGEITTALFPAYFAVTLTLGLMATILLVRHRRHVRDFVALVLQCAALAALAAIPVFIEPAITQHPPGTPGFARLHAVSMSLNLFSLITVPAASLLVVARRKE